MLIATKEEKNKCGAIGRKEILSNPSADILFGPVPGPLKSSFKSRNEEFGVSKNALTGHVEVDAFDEFTFNKQYHTYQSFCYALDPSRGVTTAWYQESNAVRNKDKNQKENKNNSKDQDKDTDKRKEKNNSPSLSTQTKTKENDNTSNRNSNNNINSNGNNGNSKYIGDSESLKRI